MNALAGAALLMTIVVGGAACSEDSSGSREPVSPATHPTGQGPAPAGHEGFSSADDCPVLSPDVLPSGAAAGDPRHADSPAFHVVGKGGDRVTVGRGQEVLDHVDAEPQFPEYGTPVASRDGVRRWVIAVGDPPLGQIMYQFRVGDCPYVLWTGSGLTWGEALDFAAEMTTRAEGAQAARFSTCQAGDLTATFTRDQEGAGGHLLRLIQLRNVSNATRLLRGYPRRVVATRIGEADVIAVNGSWFPYRSRGPVRPGKTADLGLQADDACRQNQRGMASDVRYDHVKLMMAGGALRLRVPSPGLDVTCGLRVTRFMEWR